MPYRTTLGLSFARSLVLAGFLAGSGPARAADPAPPLTARPDSNPTVVAGLAEAGSGVGDPGYKSSGNGRPGDAPLTAFSTGGHSIYHLQPATVDRSGERAIVSAAFDGTVLCHSRTGQLVWKVKANDPFPFDLAVADIDGDGLDEVLVATAGGTVDAYDHDGKVLWSFAREAPLYQVCPILAAPGRWVILTGGIEETLFSLAPTGELLASMKAGDVVRHIRRGNIKGDGKQYAAVATASVGRNGKLSLLLVDPENLGLLWRKTDLEKGVYNNRQRFFSMVVFDLNGDGRDEIVVGSSWEYHGLILGYDHRGERVLQASDKRIPNANYRMNLLTHVQPAGGPAQIFSLYANYLILYDARGRFQSLLTSRCERRMLNFLPPTPYGLVAIVPDNLDLSRFPRYREKVSTDGEVFYDETGRKRGAAEYKPIMIEKLRQSAARLPVLVKGEAAWSAVRIDATHLRIVLVDPGYTDPAPREVEIALQGIVGLECTDILSGEKLPIQNGTVRATVPAGLFRIVDLKHGAN